MYLYVFFSPFFWLSLSSRVLSSSDIRFCCCFHTIIYSHAYMMSRWGKKRTSTNSIKVVYASLLFTFFFGWFFCRQKKYDAKIFHRSRLELERAIDFYVYYIFSKFSNQGQWQDVSKNCLYTCQVHVLSQKFFFLHKPVLSLSAKKNKRKQSCVQTGIRDFCVCIIQK